MSEELKSVLNEYNNRIVETNNDAKQSILIYSTRRHQIMPDPKYVGGLADRLKGLMTVFYLAVLSNRRFVVHWDSPLNLEENLLPSRYDWRLRFAQRLVNASDELSHVDLVDRSEILDELDVDQQINKFFGNQIPVIININSFRITKYLPVLSEMAGAEISYGEAFREAFQFLFNFVERPETESSRTKLNQFRADADLMVGVHLRTGAGNNWNDPVLDDWLNYRLVLESAFKQATERGAVNPVFWFLSDSRRAREAVLSEEWPYRVYTEAVDASHMDRSQNVDVLSHHQTFFDFELLAKSDFVVCGEGGFAPIAALAGGTPMVRYK